MTNKVLTTKRTSLINIDELDYDTIYEWYTDFDYNLFWTSIRSFPSKKSFLDLFDFNIKNNFTYYFFIQNSNGEKVGTIFLHDYNKNDNYASLSIFILPQYQNNFFGIDAFKIITNFIHRNLPIRKLYFDVYSYNKTSSKILNKIGFNLEGIFKKHRYYNGTYHDLKRYSLFLNDWEKVKKDNGY